MSYKALALVLFVFLFKVTFPKFISGLFGMYTTFQSFTFSISPWRQHCFTTFFLDSLHTCWGWCIDPCETDVTLITIDRISSCEKCCVPSIAFTFFEVHPTSILSPLRIHNQTHWCGTKTFFFLFLVSYTHVECMREVWL